MSIPSNKNCIAIDVMGGDHGASVVIPALDIALKGRDDVFFLLFGDEGKITPFLDKYPHVQKNSLIRHTDKSVSGEDQPSHALRNSKGTGMRMAIEAVRDGEALAVVSAGNTGALMAMAKMVLKMLPNIHRPALAAILPGTRDDTIMLDLGANVLVDAENLVQFSLLGTIFAKAYKKIERPTIGLLNVGSEDVKGPDHVRQAAEILRRIDIPADFKGFVEGDDITKGTVDVIVSDGYAGNIALKSIEGTGKMMRYILQEAFRANPLNLMSGLLSYFPLKSMKNRMNPSRYNGAVFLGVNGICIKSHGGADAYGFSSAVTVAVRLARQGYVEQVVRDIGHLTDQESFITP